MRSALALTAVLAWIMIQVPVVFCDSGCGESVSSVLAMGAHDCHDEASSRHQTRCGHQHGIHQDSIRKQRGHRDCGHGHETPEQPEQPEDAGEHVVVLVQAPASGSVVTLPPHTHARSMLAATLLDAMSLEARDRSDATDRWTELDPPRSVDPVSAADLLQV